MQQTEANRRLEQYREWLTHSQDPTTSDVTIAKKDLALLITAYDEALSTITNRESELKFVQDLCTTRTNQYEEARRAYKETESKLQQARPAMQAAQVLAGQWEAKYEETNAKLESALSELEMMNEQDSD